MRLKVLDQCAISTIQAGPINEGQVIECSDFAGAELLKRHPKLFEQLADDGEKAEGAPLNKALGAAEDNKADYAGKTVAELKKLAHARNIDLGTLKAKDKIIKVLEAADAAAAEKQDDAEA